MLRSPLSCLPTTCQGRGEHCHSGVVREPIRAQTPGQLWGQLTEQSPIRWDARGRKPPPSPVTEHGAVRGYLGTTSQAHPPGTVPLRAGSVLLRVRAGGLVLLGRAFLHGTARRETHISCVDVTTPVTQTKGRTLSLPAKSPLLTVPCPRRHWHPSCRTRAAKHPKTGRGRNAVLPGKNSPAAQDPDLLPPWHEAEPEETQSLSEPPPGPPTPSSFPWCLHAGAPCASWPWGAGTESNGPHGAGHTQEQPCPAAPRATQRLVCPSQNHQPEISSFASESPKG